MNRPVRPAVWGVLLLTVLAIGVLVKLGMWQLDRAEEKRTLMADLASRESVSLSWPLPGDPAEQLAGHRVSGIATPVPGKALLLDNQTREGQVGYRWLQPVRLDDQEAPWLLLDLGFIPVPRGSRALPALLALPERFMVEGRLYQVGHNPLNPDLLPEAGAITRIQALNMAQLSAHWSASIVPVVMLVESPSELGYPRSWEPINLSPEKHQGYALQWFGLAVALTVILLVMLNRGRLQRSAQADRLES
ncbi:SURF1 family protein [Ferrimonas balearica]|uniref:SURF1 family protein n=1 Tax=Ferrimonas balearica TaxID=44012 RepID=UPI001C98EE3F|nr:SURF1 family protein [Ferrimonas balearica]MBY5923551.1 SURF1 family protein [Ferrimonas balearica]MBY5997900.1 SURF1 family protein [Ferrimonas balearica]